MNRQAIMVAPNSPIWQRRLNMKNALQKNAERTRELLEYGAVFPIHWKMHKSKAKDTKGMPICSCYIGIKKVGVAKGLLGGNMLGCSLSEFIINAYWDKLCDYEESVYTDNLGECLHLLSKLGIYYERCAISNKKEIIVIRKKDEY